MCLVGYRKEGGVITRNNCKCLIPMDPVFIDSKALGCGFKQVVRCRNRVGSRRKFLGKVDYGK